jgi:hypothetical protein
LLATRARIARITSYLTPDTTRRCESIIPLAYHLQARASRARDGLFNFLEWKIKINLYLEINSYILYIEGFKERLNKAFYFKTIKNNQELVIITDEPYNHETAIKYYERSAEFKQNQNKALGALKSILSIKNIEQFKNIDSVNNLF